MTYEEKIESASLILKNRDLKLVYLKFRHHLEYLDGSGIVIPHRLPNGQYNGLYDGIIFNLEILAKICMEDSDDLRGWFKKAPVSTDSLIPFANMARRYNSSKSLLDQIINVDNSGIGELFFFLDASGTVWSIWNETVYKVVSSIDEFLLEITSGLAHSYPESYDVCYD